MRMSDIVAKYIIDMMEEEKGVAEIQRNELANSLGCVPSQINYVITSRFTPEHGYIVESRRGGGGFIRITRINTTKDKSMMHIINSIGDTMDKITAEVMIENMLRREIIDDEASNLFLAAMSERSYLSIPQNYRDTLRASIFKNMLLTLVE